MRSLERCFQFCMGLWMQCRLYWITKRAGERSGSGLMKANAWHHRADVVSSLDALIGGWWIYSWGEYFGAGGCCNTISSFGPNQKDSVTSQRSGGKFEMLDRILPKLKATDRWVYYYIPTEFESKGDTSGGDRGSLIDQFNKPGSPFFIFHLRLICKHKLGSRNWS
ncbi:unnamed protein product [Lactuca saligna]|uniref:Uncharacterized protein n=1 Tax=Lactuca saligna TaxID=75948 RepID=A0AA36EE81_LACSI|nr:unnamed protein product [Lactuca saligna]